LRYIRPSTSCSAPPEHGPDARTIGKTQHPGPEGPDKPLFASYSVVSTDNHQLTLTHWSGGPEQLVMVQARHKRFRAELETHSFGGNRVACHLGPERIEHEERTRIFQGYHEREHHFITGRVGYHTHPVRHLLDQPLQKDAMGQAEQFIIIHLVVVDQAVQGARRVYGIATDHRALVRDGEK